MCVLLSVCVCVCVLSENAQSINRFCLCVCDVDPVDGVKGKTWGPSVAQKDRHHRASWFGDGRWSKSAPNLEKSLKTLGGHSNIGALQELGM